MSRGLEQLIVRAMIENRGEEVEESIKIGILLGVESERISWGFEWGMIGVAWKARRVQMEGVVGLMWEGEIPEIAKIERAKEDYRY